MIVYLDTSFIELAQLLQPRMREEKVAIITGTNSNLGLNIAYRLLHEIDPSTNLTLIVTSRTLPRVKDVITDIKNFSRKHVPERTGWLEFDYLLVDFTDNVSILSASEELRKKFSHIDYLFLNAAQGCYDGIDWIQAFKCISINLLDAVTFPNYKIQRVGVKSRDDMGLVFQGNVFGPYYFVHRIKSLLSRGGKIIWISSIMSDPKYLSFNDLQLLLSPEPYEGSKRLVDLLHMGTYKKLKSKNDIISYIVHPGIFSGYSFYQYLNFLTYYGMLILFYIARFLGSVIHNISGYTAANAPVTVALNDDLSQDVKHASHCDRYGKEFLGAAELDRTGAQDVAAYMDDLVIKWDEILKNQITSARSI